MKITLKRNWDSNVAPPMFAPRKDSLYDKNSQGIFIGRNKEKEFLTNEILRRTGGAILVSGHRGVGKTALVYKALWEAKSADQNIIVVLLNASQLDKPSEENKTQSGEVVKNLIRRLYSTTRENVPEDIKEKVEVLYRKAVAKEFKLIESYGRRHEESNEFSVEHTSSFNEKGIEKFIFIGSWIVAITLQLNDSFLFGGWFKKILPLTLAYPIPSILSFAYQKSARRKSLDQNAANAESLYQFDSSIGNLEFDLEQVHAEFRKSGLKLVYVIDELDKLGIERIKEVIKYFKNLFTLSDAFFIFLGGPELYEIGMQPGRPEEYTYFSTRYLLSRPRWDDLVNYFEAITEKKDMSELDFEKLIRAIAFDAKNDFFDLRTVINDRITEFDGEKRPVIEIQGLSEDDQRKSMFHETITILFEKRYISSNPSKWRENELIIKSLFDQAHKVFLSYSGSEFSDTPSDSVPDSAIRDFNAILFRVGIFSVKSDAMHSIRGLSVPIRIYSYGNSAPLEVPRHLFALLEHEQRFLNAFSRYGNYALALNNAFKIVNNEQEITVHSFWQHPETYFHYLYSMGFDFLSQFNAHLPMYRGISQTGTPLAFSREDIDQRTLQISAHTSLMLEALNTVIPNLLARHYNSNLILKQIAHETRLFNSDHVIRPTLQGYNPWVLYKSDFSRQILFLYNQSDILAEVKANIRSIPKNHKLVIVSEQPVEIEVEGIEILLIENPTTLKNELVKLIINWGGIWS